jgi:hypothetical protein
MKRPWYMVIGILCGSALGYYAPPIWQSPQIVTICIYAFSGLLIGVAAGIADSMFPQSKKQIGPTRFGLRALLWAVALLPPLIVGLIAWVQLDWYRRHGLPTGTDPAIQFEIEKARAFQPFNRSSTERTP